MNSYDGPIDAFHSVSTRFANVAKKNFRGGIHFCLPCLHMKHTCIAWEESMVALVVPFWVKMIIPGCHDANEPYWPGSWTITSLGNHRSHQAPQHAVNTPRIQGWGRLLCSISRRVLRSISRQVFCSISEKMQRLCIGGSVRVFTRLCSSNPGQIFSLYSNDTPLTAGERAEIIGGLMKAAKYGRFVQSSFSFAFPRTS